MSELVGRRQWVSIPVGWVGLGVRTWLAGREIRLLVACAGLGFYAWILLGELPRLLLRLSPIPKGLCHPKHSLLESPHGNHVVAIGKTDLTLEFVSGIPPRRYRPQLDRLGSSGPIRDRVPHLVPFFARDPP